MLRISSLNYAIRKLRVLIIKWKSCFFFVSFLRNQHFSKRFPFQNKTKGCLMNLCGRKKLERCFTFFIIHKKKNCNRNPFVWYPFFPSSSFDLSFSLIRQFFNTNIQLNWWSLTFVSTKIRKNHGQLFARAENFYFFLHRFPDIECAHTHNRYIT